ncbi:MAG: HAD family phosphatase [Planctomycetes bacterium]|nr:HAD family phosphatase [Planctomycetota bacterium]MBU1519052.1 HAD family phosphatase [Planctomycetota bacterium]MBU2596392.1 HAD family phosphatase [Planctomycetota bacterium]
MAKIKAVIFDLDGVLVDAKEWHYEALNRALGLFGMEINRYDHLVTYDGLPTLKKLEMLSIEHGLPRSLHKLINDIKQQYTMGIVHAQCKAIFCQEYALSKLNQDGYKLAVCSNSIRKSIETMLENAGIAQYFDFYISNQDVKKPKPDSEMYIKAFKKFGLQPKECLIIEDNEKGIKAALASGAYLMKVDSVEDVNYLNIMGKIAGVERENK